MLPSTLLRRTLALNLHLLPLTRAASTMAPNYALDRSIFNADLYARMRSFWFQDISPNATGATNFETTKRWFGVGISQEQKDAFDRDCYTSFGRAIEALVPENVRLPEFKGYEQEVEQAGEIAGPLLEEVKGAQAQSGKDGAETLLSLILLLDQMPRNIYRTKETLPLVYTHFDRLAYALLRSSMSLQPSPVAYEDFRHRPVFKSWLMMPLMHTESLEAHKLWDEYERDCEKAIEERGDEQAKGYLEQGHKAAEKHADILKQFGRYPHRNECLGRKSTPEELEWLKTGDTFGVKQGSRDMSGKDEL